MALTKPMKNGWVLVRRQLDEIEQAAGTLSQALATTCGLTAHALLRTGSQLHTQRFLQQLNSLIQDVSRALELVPENNMGDAVGWFSVAKICFMRVDIQLWAPKPVAF